jgi:hypothetical protein
MDGLQTCACGCRGITSTAPSGVQRTWRRGHNRRVVGSRGSRGWLERGYRFIRVNGKKIAEHRHILEVREGRKLNSNEIVHHADSNPLNNDPANLVILTRSQHQRLHACSSRKPWKIEETKQAVALRAAGMTIWEISLVLGRPFSTTARRLAKLAKESPLVSALPPSCDAVGTWSVSD